MGPKFCPRGLYRLYTPQLSIVGNFGLYQKPPLCTCLESGKEKSWFSIHIYNFYIVSIFPKRSLLNSIVLVSCSHTQLELQRGSWINKRCTNKKSNKTATFNSPEKKQIGIDNKKTKDIRPPSEVVSYHRSPV